MGTRSLLFGVHQVLWHPWLVLRAWRMLYGRPTWREVVCILIHDWGYWGRTDMDGAQGMRHPEIGAALAGWLLGPAYRDLVLYHSRAYAARAGRLPSRLCWADKASFVLEPAWWYLLRARMSGELREYRAKAAASGVVPRSATDAAWFQGLATNLSLASGLGAAPKPAYLRASA